MATQTTQSHDMGITQAHQTETPPAYSGNDKSAVAQQYAQHSQPGQQPQQQHMQYPQQGQQQGGPQMVTPLDRLGDFAQDVDCPNCRRVTRTRFEDHASGLTFVMVILLALCCLLLFWIPLAAKFAYDKEWYCTNCNYKLAYQMHDAPIIVPHLQQQPAAVQNHPAYGQPQQQQQQQQIGQTQGQIQGQPQNYELQQHLQQQQQQQGQITGKQ